MNTGDPIDRSYLLRFADDRPTETELYWGISASHQRLKTQNKVWSEKMLALLDKYGVNALHELPREITATLPNQGRFKSNSSSLFQQVVSFVTNPGVLTAAAGIAGVLGAGSAASGATVGGGTSTGGAGALPGVSTPTGSLPGLFEAGGAVGGETALGTGLIPGAAGVTGLTSGAGGAAGISGTAASGTALAPGFFASETSMPVVGGAAAAASGAPISGAYKFPYMSVLGSLLEYGGQKKSAETLNNLMQRQMESDKWRDQQSRYFEPLYQAATQGIGSTPYGRSLSEATARKMASMGYNMSGNQMAEIAKSLDLGSQDYIRAISPLAMGRGESTAPGTFGSAITGAQKGKTGALGYGLAEILKGQQPQQGQGTNQNLLQWLGSLV